MNSLRTFSYIKNSKQNAKYKNPAFSRNFSTQKSKILIISGSTGVGKTDVSIDVASHLGNCEIISADSAQVYKELSVGTNKIPLENQKGIKHHLLDFFPLSRSFDANEFYETSTKLADEIIANGKTPVVVGGTGFYMKWFVYGRGGTAPKARADRLNYWAERARMDWDASILELKKVDPEFVKTLSGYDAYRFGRAMDVYEQTGKPYSSFKLETTGKPRNPNYDYRVIFLSLPRELAYQIGQFRCERFVERGLLQEVKLLMKEGKLSRSSHAAKFIGYSQAIDFFERNQYTVASFKKFMDDFQIATRQYMQTQMGWFRTQQQALWIENTDILKILHPDSVPEDTPSTAAQIIKAYEATEEEFENLKKDPGQEKLKQLPEGTAAKLKEVQSRLIVFNDARKIYALLDQLKKL